MLKYFQFFPTHVAIGRVENAPALNSELMADIERVRTETPNSKPSSWACQLYTTFVEKCDLHESTPAFERLAKVFLQHSEAYADYLEVDPKVAVPRISECWLNVYQGGTDSQEVHNHGGYHFSGIYYVKAPPGCGRLNFYTPLVEDNFAQIPGTKLSWKTQGMGHVEPEDGMIVIFRSWLRHAVTPGTPGDERISIAFNVLFEPPG